MLNETAGRFAIKKFSFYNFLCKESVKMSSFSVVRSEDKTNVKKLSPMQRVYRTTKSYVNSKPK